MRAANGAWGAPVLRIASSADAREGRRTEGNPHEGGGADLRPREGRARQGGAREGGREGRSGTGEAGLRLGGDEACRPQGFAPVSQDQADGRRPQGRRGRQGRRSWQDREASRQGRGEEVGGCCANEIHARQDQAGSRQGQAGSRQGQAGSRQGQVVARQAQVVARQARRRPPYRTQAAAWPGWTRQAVRRRTALAALWLALAACAPGGAAGQSVRIGIGAPLSGSDEVYGKAITLGVEQAVADLGESFAGRRAQPVPRDDKNDPKKGVEVAKGFVADKIGFVVGHFSSAVTVPASGVYAAAGVLMVTPTAEAPLVTDRGLPTIFRTCGRADEEAATVARFVAARRAARVAIVHDRSGAGREFATACASGSVRSACATSTTARSRKARATSRRLAGRIKAAKAEACGVRRRRRRCRPAGQAAARDRRPRGRC